MKKFIQKILLLGPRDSPSRSARLVHVGVIFYIFTAATIGVVLAKSPWLSTQRAAGTVLITVFSVYILERIFSLLWEWPLTRVAIRSGTIVKHPLLLWLVTFLVFGASALEPEPLYIIQDATLPILFRWSVISAVVVNGLPFWITTCFLFSLIKASRGLRGQKESWLGRGRIALFGKGKEDGNGEGYNNLGKTSQRSVQ